MHRLALRVDVVLAAASALLLGLTLVLPDWIEVVLRVDPDAGGGGLERLIVGALACGTLSFGLMARRVWRLSRA